MPVRILLDIPITFAVGDGTTHAPMIDTRVGEVATKLILDTGSTDHVLTIELAREAGLDAEPGEAGTDHAGDEVPSWTLGTVAARIDRMPITLRNAVAITGPAKFAGWGVGGFLSPQHIHPSALAVLDLADDRFLLVDDDPDEVRGWVADRGSDLVALTCVRDPAELTPVIEAAIEPFPAVPVMFNTGGRGTEFATAAVPGLRGVEPERLGHGVGGSVVPGSEVTDRTLLVGDARFALPRLLIREHVGSMLGLIGMDVLRGTVLVLGADPAAGVSWLVPSTSLPDREAPRTTARP